MFLFPENENINCACILYNLITDGQHIMLRFIYICMNKLQNPCIIMIWKVCLPHFAVRGYIVSCESYIYIHIKDKNKKYTSLQCRCVDKYLHQYRCRCFFAILLSRSIIFIDGQVAKWLEHLTAVRNIDGSSRTLGS